MSKVNNRLKKRCLALLAVILVLGFGAGMGLPNMKRYTDDMKIDTKVGEGTKITLTVNL